MEKEQFFNRILVPTDSSASAVIAEGLTCADLDDLSKIGAESTIRQLGIWTSLRSMRLGL